MGSPPCRGARSSLLHHLVDLLQGQTLGLGDEEVGVDKGTGAERAPDEEDLGAQVALVVVYHVRGDDRNDLYSVSRSALENSNIEDQMGTYAVPQPVRSSGQGDTTRSDRQREDLADHDPGAWTPGAGEEEDVDADKGNHGADGLGVGTIGHTENGDDELADHHAQGTPQQQRATADLLDGVEGERCRKHVDNGGDHAQQEGVLDGTQLLEEGGSKVEHEVDTSPPRMC